MTCVECRAIRADQMKELFYENKENCREAYQDGYNQALEDAIEFFMNHIHCNNDKPIVRDYVCEQLEKMKK